MAANKAQQKILKGILHIQEKDKYNHENIRKIILTKWVQKQMKRKKSNTIERTNNINSECWWTQFLNQKT
jgi:hypothetical protein